MSHSKTLSRNSIQLSSRNYPEMEKKEKTFSNKNKNVNKIVTRISSGHAFSAAAKLLLFGPNENKS
jgi:hypothetical protein